MSEIPGPPASGPSPSSVAAQDEWRAVVAESLPTVRESAGRWRDGLAALVSLLTAGLVVSGPESLGDLAVPWRYCVAGGMVVGIGAVLVGLVLALGVASGDPRHLAFESFIATGGGRAALQMGQAVAGARRLGHSKAIAVPGIFLVLASLGLWLVAPQKPSESALKITTDGVTVCGTLISADHAAFVLRVEGERDALTIPFSAVTNVAVVAGCDAVREPS